MRDPGCELDVDHDGPCYVGTKCMDCGDAELWRGYREVEALRAQLAEVERERDDELASLRADIAHVEAEARHWKYQADKAAAVRDEQIRYRDEAVRRAEKAEADLARVTGERDEARTSNGMFRTQIKQAHRERADAGKALDEARADLARVTAERDEAMAALEGVGDALGGLELYALSETAGHVGTVVEERDEAEAELARVTPSAEVREAIATLLPSACDNPLCDFHSCLDINTARAWLASLPTFGATVEPPMPFSTGLPWVDVERCPEFGGYAAVFARALLRARNAGAIR